MRAALVEPSINVVPGDRAVVEIEVTNDLGIIEGIRVSIPDVPGLSWSATPERLPLFPDGTGRIRIELRVESTFPAGDHDVRVVLRSDVDAETELVEHLALKVAPRPGGELSVDPLVRRGRHRVTFAARINNTGNTILEVALAGSDASHAAAAKFTTPVVTVGPGQSAQTEMIVSAKRRVLGGEISRQMSVVGDAGTLELDTKAVFRQHPLIPRGARTALILATIVALWAAIFVVVLGKAMSKDPITKQVPASFYASLSHTPTTTGLGALGGTAGFTAATGGGNGSPAGAVPKSGVVIGVGGTISGTVDAASTGAGVGRINVEAVQIIGGSSTVDTSAATGSDGSYSIPGLLPGAYKLLFEAQGYKSVWYPDATSEGAAKPVTVDALADTGNADAVISGLPGSISGTLVTGETPSPPVTITVQPQLGVTHPIATVTSSSDGSYTIPNLPTPNTYDLSYSSPKYETASASDELAGGEALIADAVQMSASPGSITGTVTAGGKPLGGVTISAQANGHTYSSATPTTGTIGQFVLTGLPTPATYLLSFSATGYGTKIIGLNLGPGKNLAKFTVALTGGAGDISGTVSSSAGNPLGGVTVTVGGGATAQTTQTLTAGTVGAFSLSGLSTPGNYTLTFSLAGYESQTIGATLTSSGSDTGLKVQLSSDLATITGTVTDASTGAHLTGVTVAATDGATVTNTTSTSQPAGGFLLSGLAPGSYSVTFSDTGYASVTYLVKLTPGESSTVNAELEAS